MLMKDHAVRDKPEAFAKAMRSALFGVALSGAMLTCPASAKEPAMLLEDHPLVDTLWHLETGAIVDVDRLRADVEKADHVLIGEKHDNVIHHDRQALIVSMVREAGKSGQLVLEMADNTHEEILSGASAATVDSLGAALDWQRRGWGDWKEYQPIVEEAMGAGMRLKPGNPDRATLMHVGRGGEARADMLSDLRWDVDYGDAMREDLLDELVDAHCGMMPREQLGPLATMQRLKDAFMARSMRQSLGNGETAVLIAGNGHVRKDRGVPMFLDQDRPQVSVALVEVVRDETNQADYPSFDPALYDYVWFTPRVDEIDPCEKFRKQLEGMKSSMGKHGQHE